MANARSEYKRHASEAQKLGEADQLTALSFAVDDLVDAIGNSWCVCNNKSWPSPPLAVTEACKTMTDNSAKTLQGLGNPRVLRLPPSDGGGGRLRD